MPSPASLDHARTCHRTGDLPQAEHLCRSLLRDDPENAPAWQLLAAVLLQLGRHADAGDAARHALRLLPDSTEAHFALGQALAGQGQRRDGLAHYRDALRLRPDYPQARTALGITLAEHGQLPEAVTHLRQAAADSPDSPQAQHNLGVALAQSGRPAEAVGCLERALALQPDYPDARFNLGTVLKELGRREEALPHFRRALEMRPEHAGACNNLGLTLVELNRPAEAVPFLRHATRLQPQMKEAHNNLGLALADLGRFAEAEACYREALRLDPRYVEAHNNLGSAAKEQGRFDEALSCYQLALYLSPQSASTHYNRALAYLAKGDYAQGWAEYEWRWRRPQSRPRPFRQPRWDGAPLEGKTILLWSEQGLGDVLHFIRYAPLVQSRGGRVVVECPRPLLPLLSTCRGIDQLVTEKQPLPDFDLQAPLMSLPGLLGTTLEGVPAEVPYLHAEPARVESWARRLGGDGLRMGIVWQGNPRFQWDRHRSVPLSCFAPLAAVDGVRLVTLQKGPGTEQLAAACRRFPVEVLGDDFDATGGAFLDTAAVMKNLDLVVCCDTAAVHLAGALGVPAWLALSAVCDWRWLRDRDDTPWYPTVRLFRQDRLGDWAPVFERMAAQLRQMASARRGPGVQVPISPGDLLDRLSILAIRSERLTDPARLAPVRAELLALTRARDESVPRSDELCLLESRLRSVNERLWEVEDELRLCERDADFGPRFVELARSVYRHNDERAALKRQINDLLGAASGEQKAYPAYREQRSP